MKLSTGFTLTLALLFAPACTEGDPGGMDGSETDGGGMDGSDPVLEEDPCPDQEVRPVEGLQTLQEGNQPGNMASPFTASDGPNPGDLRYTVLQLPSAAMSCQEVYLRMEGDHPKGKGNLGFRLSLLIQALGEGATITDVAFGDLVSQFQPPDQTPFYLEATPWTEGLVSQGAVLRTEEANGQQEASFAQPTIGYKCCPRPLE